MSYLCIMEDNKCFSKEQDNQVLPTQLVDDVKLIVERGLHEAYRSVNSISIMTIGTWANALLKKNNMAQAVQNTAHLL